ncbi:hypothetical protein PQQ99_33785 [Paraburkholderia sediminicola]|uniref:hypothetical protein n=1 Tax=Paraburkholderia sediminicola TaxID=458836 RepID=UPI0038BA32D6
MLTSTAWHQLFTTQRARLPRVVNFALNPAQDALPARIAGTLGVPAEFVETSHRRDARPWSRRLLEHHAELEQLAPDLDACGEALWLALLTPREQRRLAAHVGAARLALALRRLVSREALAPFATRELLDVVRFAQRLEHDDAFTLCGASAWPPRRLARATLPLGFACLLRAQASVPARLAWRWQLRHPAPVRADAALDPHHALRLCVLVATRLEPTWIS